MLIQGPVCSQVALNFLQEFDLSLKTHRIWPPVFLIAVSTIWTVFAGIVRLIAFLASTRDISWLCTRPRWNCVHTYKTTVPLSRVQRQRHLVVPIPQFCSIPRFDSNAGQSITSIEMKLIFSHIHFLTSLWHYTYACCNINVQAVIRIFPIQSDNPIKFWFVS